MEIAQDMPELKYYSLDESRLGDWSWAGLRITQRLELCPDAARWYISRGSSLPLQNVFFWIIKCICPNCKMYLSKLPNVLVQITKCIYLALFWSHLFPKSVFGRYLFWSPSPPSDISISPSAKAAGGGHIQNISISNPRNKSGQIWNRENYICFIFNGFPASRVPEMESDRRQLTRNVLFGQKSFFVLKPHP